MVLSLKIALIGCRDDHNASPQVAQIKRPKNKETPRRTRVVSRVSPQRQGEDVLYDAWNLIEEDATAIFMGEFEAQDLSNVFTTFYVSGGGLLEFQQDALFETGTYVVYENQGTIK